MRQGKYEAPKVRREAGGIWSARASLGYDRVTRKQCRAYRSFPEAKSQAEAQRMCDEWFSALSGMREGAGSLKLRELLPYFVETLPVMTKANTRKQYGYCAKRLVPLIGGIEFDRLKTSDVNSAIRVLIERYAPATVRQTRAFLGAAYRHWVDERLILLNPVPSSDRLGQPDPATEKALGKEASRQVDAALRAMMFSDAGPLATRVNAAALWLMLHSGMRRGEALGLRIADWDGDAGKVHIGATAILTRGGPARQPRAKTKKSNRTLALSPDSSQVLAEWLDLRRGWVPAASQPFALLFCTEAGRVTNPDTFTRWVRRNRERLGLPPGITPHAMRHTFATQWVESGSDLGTLSAHLGHSDVSTTLKHYVARMPGVDESGAARTDERISSKEV